MNPHTHQPRKSNEAGVALLIALFMLLLVSAVAVSLMMSSGTESSLASNYRSSTSAYYAAYAGIEEARGRLLPTNPSSLVPLVVPAAGLAVGPPVQVRYILNALPGEVVAPNTPGNAYFDTEFQQEWNTSITTAAVQTTPSVSNTGGFQGPMFKWVRITPATEQSINLDVDNRPAPLDNALPLFFDPAHLNAAGAPAPSLIVNAAPPSTASQAYEIASLAVLPNGAKKLLEYVVTPVTFNLNFPSALTLAASSITFHGANSTPYHVNGTDGSGNPGVAVPGCNPNATTSLPAIGTTDPPGSQANVSAISSNIPRPGNYTGAGLATPSVANVSLNSALNSPTALNSLVQQITQNANLVLSPPAGSSASSSQLPSSMIVNGSTCTPETVVVQGDFDLGPTTGCGLLVVTGNFNYQGNSGWNGVILVIGTGTTTFSGMGGGNGQFDGAVFVASTNSTDTSLGPVSFDISGGGGNGIYYNSCWVKQANQPVTLQVLSFREISQ